MFSHKQSHLIFPAGLALFFYKPPPEGEAEVAGAGKPPLPEGEVNRAASIDDLDASRVTTATTGSHVSNTSSNIVYETYM